MTRGRQTGNVDFYAGIRALQQKYDVVVVIARNKLLADEQVWSLRQDGIHLFGVGK